MLAIGGHWQNYFAFRNELMSLKDCYNAIPVRLLLIADGYH